MHFIIDAHEDLAWNMLTYGRDYTRSAHETRRLEAGSPTVAANGDCLIGWPEYQAGRVIAVFSTLYASPKRAVLDASEKIFYRDSDYQSAHRLYWQQLELYRRLADSQPDHFRLIASRADLSGHLALWESPSAQEGRPVGLIPLMEGADGIRSPSELAQWWDFGLRLIGLAWAGTRYSGGTNEPGPLTDEGRALLRVMADFPFTLDLSHMDEAAALEALDLYEGPIIASHANCLALLEKETHYRNRHLSDRVLRGIIERDGIIGIVPFNTFLKPGWRRVNGSRAEVPLSALADHMDHICQLAGNARHAALGSDFDGGFGLQSVPPEIDTIADLQKIADFMIPRGYTDEDLAAALGKNWLRHLETHLPA